MFFSLDFRGEEYKIEPWTTRDEMAYLLYGEDASIKDIFNLLVKMLPTPKNLTDDDMLYFLYKAYVNSVGGDFTVQYKCTSCAQPNENTINIDPFIDYCTDEVFFEVDEYKINTNDYSVYKNNIKMSPQDAEDFIDDMDFATAQEMAKMSNKSLTVLCEMECIKCQNIDIKDCLDFYKIDLSKSNIGNIYQQAQEFTYYGKIALADVYNMLPFEREIFFSLIEKTREEENQA